MVKTDYKKLNTPALIEIVKRIPSYTKALYRLYTDPEIAGKQKMLLTVGLGYMVSPIDVIPGFIPVAGQLDDIIVALTALKKVVDNLPDEKVLPILSGVGLSRELLDEDLRQAKSALHIMGHNIGKLALQVGHTGWTASRYMLNQARCAIREYKRQKDIKQQRCLPPL